MPALTAQTVRPALEFIPPNYSGLVRRGTQLALPWWMSSQLRVAHLEIDGADRLARLYGDFQRDRTRLLLAFRHPCTDDPFAIAHLLWRAVPAAARRQGIALRPPVHSHFIYDRGIPLWAGGLAGWLFSRLGGIPIQRGKVDRQALKTARHILSQGRFPLAIAPEGGTNQHNERLSPLEPGVAQLAFWCADDLVAENRPERMLVVPIGLQYAYITPPWAAIDDLLSELETDLGLPNRPTPDTLGTDDRRYYRLFRLGETLLGQMEDFYRQFYGQAIPEPPATDDPNRRMGDRLHALLDIALQVAETYFQIKPSGSKVDRCRRLEQAGWDRIFRADEPNLSPVERGLADWVAAEASSRMGHMRLVENFTAVTGQYVREKPTAERFAETLLILWRVTAWICGRDRTRTPNLGPRRLTIRIGDPIDVRDRHDAYKQNRRAAMGDLTADLQTALESLIL
ncbi:MAG: glycerol acyltransferase [Cyanophyceae cyanobacterium]